MDKEKMWRRVWKKRKTALAGAVGLLIVALVCIAGAAVLPKAKAEQGLLDTARTISAGATTVSPGGYYKITGNNTSTYTLTYSGSASDEPAYIVLEDATFNLSSDIPAIVLTAQEAADSDTSSYEGNYVVYIKGKNTITSTAENATSALIQIENMSYSVKKYDRNSPYTDDVKKFKEDTVTRTCNVVFQNAGNAGDSLTVETANGSYGAAIGSREIAKMGENIKFKPGQSQWYVVIDGVRYAHGQEVFTGNLKCGSGKITVQNATILVKGNGYGAGIGTGASIDSQITFKGDNKVGSTNYQTARATEIMDGSSVTIQNGAVAVHMSTSSYGDCIGTGAVAGKPYSQGVVTITGGTMNLVVDGQGAEYKNAVNAKGTNVYKFILNADRAIGNGKFTDGMTYDLEDTVGGANEYAAKYAGLDAGIADSMEFTVTEEDGTVYVFRGYASEYFNYIGSNELGFYLPTQILDSYNFKIDGDLDSVSYEYKVGTGSYQPIDAGYSVYAKETKHMTIRLNNVPKYCTNISYATSTGQSGSIVKDTNGEYLYSFDMPSKDFSIAFQYDIGRYSIAYDMETDDSSVNNPNVATYPCGETYTLKEPSWEGRTFDGWYEDEQRTIPITSVSSEEPDEQITVYAKWVCAVTFEDDEGNILYQKNVDYGYRFMENDYPDDPEDTTLKAFLGWNIDGSDYEKGQYKEFVVTRNTVITGNYKAVGYYVHINGTFTNQDEITSNADLAKMADYAFYFKGQPIAFTSEPSQPDMYYTTVEFADRSDVTTGKITSRNGYQIDNIIARDAQGNEIQLFSSMDDEHAFTFQMPDFDVYITVNFRTPDYTISYYDYNEEGKVFEAVYPEDTAGNKTAYSFNANSPEIYLNPVTSKDKYQRFAGWYVFGDETKTVVESIPTGGYSKDLILIAIWEEVDTYPVRVDEEIAEYVKIYDADGNEVDKGIPGEILSIVVTPGRGIHFDSVTYTYTDDDQGVYTNKKTPSDGQIYPAVYKFGMPQYPVDVYGEFSLIEYQITYLSLFGAENPNPLTYNIKSKITLQDPVRTGYTFKGWTIVLPDAENGYDSVREEAIEKIENREGNLILVANWEDDTTILPKHKITISEDIQHGSIISYVQEAEEGQYVFLKIEPETGYKLNGISYNEREDVDTYSAVRSIRVLEDLLNVEIPLIDVADGVYYFIMPDKDIEIHGEFEPVEYTISYLGAENSENPVSYDVNSEIILKDASKDGYTFLGWFDEDGNKVTEIKGMTGDLVLTAKWEEIKKEPDNTNTGDNTKEPETPTPQKPEDEGKIKPQEPAKSDMDGFISQLTKLIQDKSKVDSSENTSAENNKTKAAPSQLKTGDTARVSHLVLLCILSLIILILVCPKRKDEEE